MTEQIKVYSTKKGTRLGLPHETYRVHIFKTFVYTSTDKPPSLFHRKIMEWLLGWRFEILESKNK